MSTWDNFWKKIWTVWVESRIRPWGGSSGLIIPSSVNATQGPVLIHREKGTLLVLFLNAPLNEFLEFVKEKLETALENMGPFGDIIDEREEIALTNVLLVAKALKQRSADDFKDIIPDPDDVRGFFSGISEEIFAHLELLARSKNPVEKEYHWERLKETLKFAIKSLGRMIKKSEKEKTVKI